MTPFQRLAPFIREYVHREKWAGLRPLQEAALKAFFDGADNVLVASPTASGKTEAVFFPVLSILAGASAGRRESAQKPTAIYISPLKALINDQYERLTAVTGAADGETPVKIWRWHGDVSAAHKEKFLEDGEGLLLITPESLEALLLRHSGKCRRLFGALFFAIIDEVHVFMGSDRGSQLLCQLARIREFSPDIICRRAGLSATLGDYEGARRFLSSGSGLDAVLVTDKNSSSSGRTLSLAVDTFTSDDQFYQELYTQCRDKRTIIFANSRLEAEETIAALKKRGRQRGETDIFYIHHGSVSASHRNETEEKLKHLDGPMTAAATATLELGIDIGDLDRIIQVGPPWSVSAFVQRIGRSGRRSGISQMFFALKQRQAPFPLPWDLLRTVAVIELYLKERWIEEPEEKPLPYSLLVHQILAALASQTQSPALDSCGGFAQKILALPPFTSIPPSDFYLLLGHLERCGMIGRTGEGGLLLGLEAEHIVNNHGFYSVFPDEQWYRVLLEGRELGKINFVPEPLSVITVGARYWQVDRIDGLRREITVSASNDSGSERIWRGQDGGVHRRVVQKMRSLLDDDSLAPYLGLSARAALGEGRITARKWEISRSTIISGAEGESDREFFIFPWEGSKEMRVMDLFLKHAEVRQKGKIIRSSWENFYFRVQTKLDRKAFAAVLATLRDFPASKLAGNNAPWTDKYDYLLPRELLTKQYTVRLT
ncbi:MAG: DEAD/DEAH box helicase [Treponema sp.]|jgi:ATP-dependent Lhr-like helicase|nr:DEAD/DEAH box helicase [Treponema sp.]